MKNRGRMIGLKNAYIDEMWKNYRGKYYNHNGLYIFSAYLMTVFLLWWSFRGRGGHFFILILPVIILSIYFQVTIKHIKSMFIMKRHSNWVFFLIHIPPLYYLFNLIPRDIPIREVTIEYITTYPEFIPVFILLLSNHFFFKLIGAPTKKGRRAMDALEGLKMYLKYAEVGRINRLNPPNKTPEHFEEMLPYAFALDIDKSWAQAFEEEFKKFTQGNRRHYRPHWYRGSNHFNMHAFTSSFNKAVSTTSKPRSSGRSRGVSSSGGGGGRSGGGGGGGGGGGW